MDKKGTFHDHSLLKLKLYERYLERYLTVLLASSNCNDIVIHDIFAGIGKSDAGTIGSALIAAKLIEKFSKQFPKDSLSLRLNENKPKHFAQLSKNVTPYKRYTTLTDQNANDYIENWKPDKGSHNFFFIDPHGYTQVKTENLKNLFCENFCDFLIFIPINHIYRFLKPSENKNDKEENENFLKELGLDEEERKTADPKTYIQPIIDFLSGLGIDKKDAENTRSIEEFADVIGNALKKISNSDFVYREIIIGGRGKYALFFISKHILGAEKFLEAQAKLKKEEKQGSFDFDIIDNNKSILDMINYGVSYDNVQLYEIAIKAGLLPKEVKNQILELEKRNDGSVNITEIKGKERKNKGLYISYNHWKNKNHMVSINFQKQLF